jgi:hypothetical protein
MRLPRRSAAPARASRWWAVLGLVVLTCAFYWRVTLHLGNRWPNDLQDGASFTWNLWYFQHALGHGHNPFVTHLLFHPVGTGLAFHTYVPLLGLLSWPLVALFGLGPTYGIVTLAGAALSGIGAFLLADHLLRDRWTAFFAGAAYILLPPRILRFPGHMNLNHTELLPLGILALLSFYERPTRKRSILLGLVLGASLLLESIFTAFLLIAGVAVALIRWRSTRQRPFLVGWASTAAVAVVVALPVLVPMMIELRHGDLDPLPGWGGANTTSADLLSYFVPAGFHPLWGHAANGVYGRVTFGERFTFPGFTVLLLALVGFWLWRHSQKRLLGALTAIFFVLSLGPFLHVANHQGGLFHYLGERFNVPLPFLLIHFTPVLSGVRVPGRFGFVVDLLLAVVAAGGLAVLIERTRGRLGDRRWIAPTLTLVAVAILAVEALPGSLPHLTSPEIPKPYAAIAHDPGDRAVLELPLQWRDGFGKVGDTEQDDTVFMYYATEHGKPIVNGMVARLSDKRERRLRSIDVYSQILTLQGDTAGPPASFDAADLARLGIGYVVAHRVPSAPAAFRYFGSLGLPILANDGDTLVWRVPRG